MNNTQLTNIIRIYLIATIFFEIKAISIYSSCKSHRRDDRATLLPDNPFRMQASPRATTIRDPQSCRTMQIV